MKYNNKVLQKISDNYLKDKMAAEAEEWEDFIAMYDEDEGLLEDDSDDILDETCRKSRWKHIRLNWNYHVSQLLHEGYFENEYRMSHDTWNKLYFILKDKLSPKKNVNAINMPVTVQLIMGLGLRWLTGTDINACRHIFKMSRTEAYRCAKKFLFAVLESKKLHIKLPTNSNQWRKIKHGFMMKSTNGCLSNCCGTIDGIFIKTNRPNYSEVANVRSYYSGHYEHYGVHCQAMF